MELVVGLSIWEDTFHHSNTIPNKLEPDHQLTPSIPVFDKTLLDYDTFLEMKLVAMFVVQEMMCWCQLCDKIAFTLVCQEWLVNHHCADKPVIFLQQ